MIPLLLILAGGLPFHLLAQDITLTDLELAEFTDEAKRKVKSLENYIITITDKKEPDAIKSKSLDLAVDLFMSEDKMVEVSSKNNPKTRAKYPPIRVSVTDS